MISQTEKKLNETDNSIKLKKVQIDQLTKDLENTILNEQIKLEKEKEKILEKLNENKKKAIRNFLTIKIIKEEIAKLALNKTNINSVVEIIKEFSRDPKFIENHQYFKDIIDEYERINSMIDESQNKNIIYEKYELNPDSIRKI